MILFLYLISMNIIAFLLMGYDKGKARKKGRRVRERTLLSVAIIGGSAGVYAGMQIFRHKTKHRQFVIGIPFILLLQVGIAIYLMQK